MAYDMLFSKINIGTCELRNRSAMSAMGNGLADKNGEVSEELARFYEDRAAGGCGLIVTEFCRIDEFTGQCNASQICAENRANVKSFMRLAEKVHRHGGKIFVQLHHGGREAPPALNGGQQPMGPSELMNPINGLVSREMTLDDIQTIISKFVASAVNCQKAGIDGVELHAAHGYLLGSFVSPLTNKRTDAYGGSIEGRAQIVVDIIKGIKAACGPKYPVMVRINGSDFVEAGHPVYECEGTTPEEAAKTAQVLEAAGADAIDVSCSVYVSVMKMIESNYYDEGWRKNLAKTVKAAVNIPVMAVNTIKHPETAEALLEEGVCDITAISRGQLADPEFMNKTKAGREDLIRHCMGCMECNKSVVMDGVFSCAANPVVGRGTMYNDEYLIKNGDGRKVIVIGAGSAGMQSALILAKRGFDVTILEGSDKVGGMANLAAVPPHKTLVAEFVQTQAAEMKEYGVEIKFNTKATADVVKAYNPYAVVVATGGKQIVPNVPGLDLPHVTTMEKVLTKQVVLEGKKVAIIGGGMVGLETADYLVQNNDVNIIEMTNTPGAAMYHNVRSALMAILEENGYTLSLNRALTKIEEGKIICACTDDNMKEVEFEADAVVIAVGRTADMTVRDEMETICDKVVCVGDCVKGGNLRDATRTGLDMAWFL